MDDDDLEIGDLAPPNWGVGMLVALSVSAALWMGGWFAVGLMLSGRRP